MKKLFSAFLLAALMVAALLPAAGFAADKVAKVESTGVWYSSVNDAIAAAADGDTITLTAGTITETIDPWGSDSTHASEKSITILGANAANDPNGSSWGEETILTGGLYLGYDDSQTRAHSITVKGITFKSKGLSVVCQKDVVIENNKFLEINNECNAISVLDQEYNDQAGTVTVRNNYIKDVSGDERSGINLRNPYTVTIEGNHVENTSGNSITLQKDAALEMNEGVVIISGNTLVDWGTRAVRAALGAKDTSVSKDLTFTGNDMILDGTAADPQYAKLTGLGDGANVDLTNNYWNGLNDLSTVLMVKTDEAADLDNCLPGEDEIASAPVNVEAAPAYAGPVMNWVKVNAANNGVVKSGPLAASAGATVTLYPKAAAGYVLDTVTVLDAEGNTVELDGLKFAIPAGGVTVSATFKPAE